MWVERLELKNYRGILNLSLDFPTRTTLLVGINGIGKTAILEAIAKLFSHLLTGLERSRRLVRFFDALDIQNGRDLLECRISVRVEQSATSWSVVRPRRHPLRLRVTEIRQLRERLRKALEANGDVSLPLIVLYPTNRAVLDIPLRIRTAHTFDQLAVYDDALTGGWSKFRLFFEWFRNQEDLENETRLLQPEHRDRRLEAVRKAIQSITSFKNLRVRRSPLRMTLEKDREELIVNQLSDGEKCLLALVADLARRLAIANPSLSEPLEGAGVVLIDEIELHLHPGWQRMIIPGLERTFPNCQFIVSTHSPQVISEVKPEGVVLLEKTPEGITASRASASYGRDSNRILEDLLGVSQRPEAIKNRLREYFRLIDTNQLEAARRCREELEQEIGPDEPEFARADVLMRRKELLRS